MASGIPTRACVYCNREKSWIFSGKKLKDGSKIYTNEFAVRWAGRRCPDCERARVHAAIRCDSFERELVISQLTDAGYQVGNKTLPIKVVKEGITYTVGIRHAYTEGGQITLDKPPADKADIYALVFNSVRICSAEQMHRLEPNVSVYHGRKGKGEGKGESKAEGRGDEASHPSRLPSRDLTK